MMLIGNKTRLNPGSQNRPSKTRLGCASSVLGPWFFASSYFQYNSGLQQWGLPDPGIHHDPPDRSGRVWLPHHDQPHHRNHCLRCQHPCQCCQGASLVQQGIQYLRFKQMWNYHAKCLRQTMQCMSPCSCMLCTKWWDSFSEEISTIGEY